jgi:hypothetical protein
LRREPLVVRTRPATPAAAGRGDGPPPEMLATLYLRLQAASNALTSIYQPVSNWPISMM